MTWGLTLAAAEQLAWTLFFLPGTASDQYEKIGRKRPESGLLGKHLGGFWAKLWEVWFYEGSKKHEMSNQNANEEKSAEITYTKYLA